MRSKSQSATGCLTHVKQASVLDVQRLEMVKHGGGEGCVLHPEGAHQGCLVDLALSGGGSRREMLLCQTTRLCEPSVVV